MSFFRKFKPKKKMNSDELLIASIIENLNSILNTKKDYGSYLKDFGLDDLSKCNSAPLLLNLIVEELKDNINNYEPRIKILKVTPLRPSNSYTISFRLECEVKNAKENMQVVFNTFFRKFQIIR